MMLQSLFHMWVSMVRRVRRAVHFSQVVLGATSYHSEPLPQEVVQVGEQLMALMLEEQDEGWMVSRAEQLISQCYETDTLLQVTDESGLNILQLAVVRGLDGLLLLLLEAGLNPNKALCSPALHLACSLGHSATVQMLLKHGASPSQEAGMCYPRPHVPVRHVPSRFHFLETDIYLCDGEQQLPLTYAIKGDHVKVLELLLSDESLWPAHHYPLHFACQVGAVGCIQYLARVKPSEMNTKDIHFMVPLHYGIKWDKSVVQYLIESGASVHTKTKDSKTALHLLFAKTESPKDLYETTKYLLGMGLEQDVNVMDSNLNSALHELVKHVNFLVSSYSEKESTDYIAQRDYDSQVISTLEMLAKHNCDVNQVNSSGITALHKLLVTFEFVASNDQTGIAQELLPVREKYKLDFDVLLKALKILLSHGADANLTTSADRSSLHILLQSALSIDPELLQQNKQYFFDCVSVLCTHGAHPSLSPAIHGTTVAILSKLGHRCLLQRDDMARNQLSNFLKDLIVLLTQHGLNCNHKTLKVRASSACGNLLVEMVRLAQHIQEPCHLQHIYTWVLTLLQLGANPDIEPYQSDPIICHSQSSIFLKSKSTQAVNQYMYEIQDLRQLLQGGYAQKLLLLFYNTMQHDALFQSMNSAKFMSRFDPNRVPSSHFLKMLNSLICQPRSLQQIARVAVYVAIDRKLKTNVPQLPIPERLQYYLLNVQE